MDPAVAAEGVSKTYGGGAGAVPALAGVTLTVRRGEKVAIVGKSGSGKSTLMNLVGGLDVPSAGTLRVAGHDLVALSRRRLADFRLAAVGFVFQSFHLIPSYTVLQNVELPMTLARRPAGERRAAARAALEAVGLGHRLGHRPAELSGGERQRVAVARAVVNRPELLLADEPTGNLDSANAAGVIGLMLDEIRRRGTTLLLVTHDEELAGRAADRVIRMQDGRVVADTAGS